MQQTTKQSFFVATGTFNLKICLPSGEEYQNPALSSQRALEIELEMIRQALDGKIGDEKEEKDRFLHEFCKLRARHEERLNQSLQARRNLKQVRFV